MFHLNQDTLFLLLAILCRLGRFPLHPSIYHNVLHLFRSQFISSSDRQPRVSCSRSEAEYKASITPSELLWFSYTHVLGVSVSSPFSCIVIIWVPLIWLLLQYFMREARAKHIEVDNHSVRDLVTSGCLQIKFLPSQHQLADIFKKGLPAATSMNFQSKLLTHRVIDHEFAGEYKEYQPVM